MFIITDAGGTGTTWWLCRLGGAGAPLAELHSSALTPTLLCEEEIENQLKAALQSWLTQWVTNTHEPLTDVFYYGAGCTGEGSERIRRALSLLMSNMADCSQSAGDSAPKVHVESDIFATARGTLGHKAGLACILGTGSNTCLWDGNKIVSQVPPLGYVLGDEGSGASMGRRLLVAVLRKTLTASTLSLFHHSYPGLTQDAVIQAVYRQPQANRYLASFCPWLREHAELSDLRALILGEFQLMLQRCLIPYNRQLPSPKIGQTDVRDCPLCFTGGVASHFLPYLQEAAEAEGFRQTITATSSPLPGLLRWHIETAR